MSDEGSLESSLSEVLGLHPGATSTMARDRSSAISDKALRQVAVVFNPLNDNDQ